MYWTLGNKSYPFFVDKKIVHSRQYHHYPTVVVVNNYHTHSECGTLINLWKSNAWVIFGYNVLYVFVRTHSSSATYVGASTYSYVWYTTYIRSHYDMSCSKVEREKK